MAVQTERDGQVSNEEVRPKIIRAIDEEDSPTDAKVGRAFQRAK
jgi:hypothetical protein